MLKTHGDVKFRRKLEIEAQQLASQLERVKAGIYIQYIQGVLYIFFITKSLVKNGGNIYIISQTTCPWP